jgi:hypothetical protein
MRGCKCCCAQQSCLLVVCKQLHAAVRSMKTIRMTWHSWVAREAVQLLSTRPHPCAVAAHGCTRCTARADLPALLALQAGCNRISAWFTRCWWHRLMHCDAISGLQALVVGVFSCTAAVGCCLTAAGGDALSCFDCIALCCDTYMTHARSVEGPRLA